MKITKIKEPEVTREIRAVRDRMAGHVEEEGIYPFYAALNGRAAKLMALHRSPQRAAPPRDIKSRMAKRRALLDGLAEPRAIREIRRIRDEMLAEEKRVGSDQFWAEVNRKGEEFARQHKLKYEESAPKADVLHDKLARKRN